MNDAKFAEMISKIAHELRSPLTTLQGFSATLVKRWDRFTDAQRFQFVQTIHKDAERMGRIVSEVLDLARLESGRLELRLMDADLEEVAREAARHLSEQTGAERMELNIDAGLTAWADPDRLKHVIHNLLENALKFSDEGPVRLEGRARPDGRVEIQVSDQGVGIPRSRLEEVFSGPGPSGQKSVPSGSGLGLYITRRLVEAHRGSIEVESSEGEGARFTILLPGNPP